MTAHRKPLRNLILAAKNVLVEYIALIFSLVRTISLLGEMNLASGDELEKKNK